MKADHELVSMLTREPIPGCSSHDLFNQYRQADPDHDLPDAPAIRLRNLRQFLGAFGSAVDVSYILLAEAAGYRGCRFSGVPMTSEVQLVGTDPVGWARGQGYERSSARERLWGEPSATMLWQALGDRKDCLIWNTVPWHPFGERGPLSNRPPRAAEIAAGVEVLLCLLQRYPSAQLVAVGRVAERALRSLGLDPLYVRHPAHGGKAQFTAAIQSLAPGDRL